MDPVVPTDEVRASRAGHTFHERWAARRALQLVFPKDNLFSIVVEGLSPRESLKFDKDASDIADLTLFYGSGDSFETCSAQQTMQFKYKVTASAVTASYLKKTIQKFASTLRQFKSSVSDKEIKKKLSFGFVTNAEFSSDLWDAISCLKSGGTPQNNGSQKQHDYLQTWCQEEKVNAKDVFPLIEFRASTKDLPAQNRELRRTVSDWSAGSSGLAAIRLLALVELVREKAQPEGQQDSSIWREDVLNAIECDEDQLFPADTQFVDIGDVVERSALKDVRDKVIDATLPVFLNADGGVGKTVFIQSLAVHLGDLFEVVVFDCFGGGAYRSEGQARHLPRVGLLQIINELATRGLCDPLLPTDSDQYGLIRFVRSRLKQVSETVKSQSALQGIVLIIDAADNAQLEANVRSEGSFPRLLLASLSAEPINGVKLVLTARPHRMEDVIGKSQVERFELEPFSDNETQCFLETRREKISAVELSTALTRSQGNARVLEYLVESWDTNVSGNAPKTKIYVDELIAQKCETIFKDLHTAGWSDTEIREFFAALSLLPPPIPLAELAQALDWPEPQVNSAASDLAPMLELVKHGAIFRDEPTESYIQEQYASESVAQQSIAQRLQSCQKTSIYAAEALPHFLVVIGDSNRAYELASSDEFPDIIEFEYGRRRLKLARLYAAFSLATREKDLDRVLSLTMQLSQVASANARGDQFIRRSPALATTLGDTDTSRRLFMDRSGWRGARDARLVVVHCFLDEIDEARIHQIRAIGWINWYVHNPDKTRQFDRSGPESSDIAAVLFFRVVTNELSTLNHNIKSMSIQLAYSVIDKLISLCMQHELLHGSDVLQSLAKFAASKECYSLRLQIGLLCKECGLSHSQLKALSRAASTLSQLNSEAVPEGHADYKKNVQGAITSAAMVSIIRNSKQSAKRLFKLYRHRRPSSHDYIDRHGMSGVWSPVQSACIEAWSSGKQLSYHHLMPEEVDTGRNTRAICSEVGLSGFLDSCMVEKRQDRRRTGAASKKSKRFSQHERKDIVKGMACVLRLINPIEAALLSKKTLSYNVLIDFITIWKAELRPNIHWNARTGRDIVALCVGIGVARILLRHCDVIEVKEAECIVEILNANQFSLSEKLAILELISRRSNLAEVAGAYANTLSNEVVKDDYIEQRSGAYEDLARSLIPMSMEEAREYYRMGLAQLDQMGGDDSDLVYSALHYAAEQPGGHVKPELSHRLMNLCHTIFQHEPSKFGWTLFGRAASSSIGFSAMYKLMRWSDTDVVEYSSGLPQLVCYLAKSKRLDVRRAAVVLTVCVNHGWHDWQVGDGLYDLLSIAKPEDRQAIFTLVTEKLDSESCFGGWEGIWESLIKCVEAFEEVNEEGLQDRLRSLHDDARQQREIENARYNHGGHDTDYSLQANEAKQDDQSSEDALSIILAQCVHTSASSIDKAILEVQASDLLQFTSRQLLFDRLRETCPFAKRVEFIEALCESDELEFDSALDQITTCVEVWSKTSLHVKTSIFELIKTLFAFKGSDLFVIRYSGITREFERLSTLCNDPKYILHLILETIARERVELGGDEWLQLATILCSHAKPSTAIEAFESLLSGSAAKVGDEVGEGHYRVAFAGKNSEAEVVVDIIWHLLGDSDSFVRWKAARCLKGMLDVGLTGDVESILNRFDVNENASLVSDDHYFAVQNAQQWMLMGLTRAALHHGAKLKALVPRLEALAKRTDIHAVNKLQLARCLQHIEGKKSASFEPNQLCEKIKNPPQGVVVSDGWPKNKARRIEFNFDYEFDKHRVSNLARLFGMSKNEASDCIADEIIKQWPGLKSLSDIPGVIRHSYNSDDRYETYPEHIQRHALVHAATTLVQTRQVVRDSYSWEGQNPWAEFLGEEDVSFEDGSWLSDHKNRVPAQAREYLLGERKGNQEILVKRDELIRKIGFSENSSDSYFPLYGQWKSVDGVHVRFISALIKQRGAVGASSSFSKTADHDFWLPMFATGGYVDRYSKKTAFKPLLWVPQQYPIGIDTRDEWAANHAIARPRLGLALNKLLGLKPSEYDEQWHDRKNVLALTSDVWGEWKSDPDEHRHKFQDEGAILWAKKDWLDAALQHYNQSLIYTVSFSKYKSSKSYEELSGVRQHYVGLKRSGEQPRFWFAKLASQVDY